MKPIRIDFASTRGFWRWDPRLLSVRLFLLFTLAALALTAVVVLRVRQIGAEQVRAQDALAQMEALQQQTAMRTAASSRQTPEEQALWQQAQRQLSFSWEVLFQACEVPDVAVRVQTWEPDLTRGIIKVLARAENLDGVQAYIQALQKSPVFLRVVLQRHALPEGGAGIDFAYEAVLAAPYRLPTLTEAQQ